MNSLQSRVDTFLRSKRIKKSSKKNSSTAYVKWPHPSHFQATPISLAEAGFYFNPSWNDKDSVTCFMCGKELSDWAEEDNPSDIHWSKCGTSCAWAAVKCGLKHDVDDEGNFIFPDPTRLPSHKSMEKARLDTFRAGDFWPHDSTKGHGASSKKMAQAGFVYTPRSSGDDTASCFYCNIVLDGWDADDDPLREHSKRMKKSGVPCSFFSTASQVQSSKPRKVSAKKSKTIASIPASDAVPTPCMSPSTTSQEAEIPLMTEVERDMTVEQWIRYEIDLQCERMQMDGRMRISMFRQRADEVRKRIEAL